MSKKKFGETETKALWVNNNASEKCEVTYAFNDRTDGNFKIGKSNILGENVALTIGCDGVIHGTFSGTFNGDTGICCVGGDPGDVQFNDDGQPGGDSSFKWDGLKLKVPDIRVVNIIEDGIPVATSDGTLESDADLTFDGDTLTAPSMSADAITLDGDTRSEWPAAGAPPGGSSTDIQTNDGGGGFTGNSGFTYDLTDVKIGTGKNLKIDTLTDGRVMLAGADGIVEDSADLTYAGETLSTPSASISDDLTVSSGMTVFTVNGGGVGLGNTDPRSSMQIRNNAANAVDDAALDEYNLLISRASNTNNLQVGIAFRISSDLGNVSPGAAITFERKGGNSQGDMHFKTKGSGVTLDTKTMMTISQSGDVHIQSPTLTLAGVQVLTGTGVPVTGAKGPDESVQYNDNGEMAGDAGFTYDGDIVTAPTMSAGVITLDGDSRTVWPSTTPPAGSDTDVQVKSGGSFAGDSGFTYDGGDVKVGNGVGLYIDDLDEDQVMYSSNDDGEVVGSDDLTFDGDTLTAPTMSADMITLDGDSRTVWPAGGGTPGGVANDIQTNDGGGSFAGDSGLTYDGTNVTIATGKKLFLTDLPAGRVVLGGTSGEVTQDADLTYSGDTLSTPTASVGDELTVGTSTGMSFSNTSGDFSVGTSQLFVEGATGEVGIGTATPGEDLHIANSQAGGPVTLKIENTATTGERSTRLHFRTIVSPGSGADTIFTNVVPTSGESYFDIAPGAHSHPAGGDDMIMRIRGADMGFTYYNPASWGSSGSNLAIMGNDASLDLVSSDGGTYSSILALKEVLGQSPWTFQDAWGIVKKTISSGGGLYFTYGTNNTLHDNDRIMTMLPSGFVGIGTEAGVGVNEKFTVVGGTDQENTVIIWGAADTAGNAYIGLGANTAGGKSSILAGRNGSAGSGDTDLEIKTANDGVETLTVTFNHDQTTDFEGDVTVDGNVTADNVFAVAYDFAIQGTNSPAWTSGDDVTLFASNIGLGGAGGDVGEVAARNMTFTTTTGIIQPDVGMGGAYLIEAVINFSPVANPSPGAPGQMDRIEIQEDGATKAEIYFDLDNATHASGTMTVPLSTIENIGVGNEVRVQWFRAGFSEVKYAFVAANSTFRMSRIE